MNLRHLLLALTLFSCFIFSCKKSDNITKNESSDSLLADTAQLSIPTVKGVFSDSLIPQTFKVVVLGSSTAAGYGASSPNTCWVNLLKNQTIKDGIDVNYLNLAVGGYTTSHIMPTGTSYTPGRPAPDVSRNVTAALATRPDLIIISLPTNDIASGYTDDETMANFRVIINLISASNVRYIITGTQPRNFTSDDTRERLNTLNNKLIAAYPGHVVNFLRRLSKTGYYIADGYNSGDGIHPNDKGHRIIFLYVINSPIFKDLVGYL